MLKAMAADREDDVNAPELAHWLGISAAAVYDAAQRNVIERAGRGRYPLRASIAAYCAHLRRLLSERTGSPAATARAKLLDEQAEHARLKNARLRGAVLDAEAVQAAWTGVMTRLRGRLLAIPNRMPALSRADLESLDAELRAALSELAAEADGEAEKAVETAGFPATGNEAANPP
jgi:phage terminase Nu1 subunit (DNA packaging protein)